MSKTGNVLLAASLGVGAVYVGQRVFDYELPACFRSPSLEHCLGVDVHWFDGIKGSSPSTPYTSEVHGGIIGVEITPIETPLFTRTVELDPLEIKKDNNVVYEERSVQQVTTTLHGRIAAITRNQGGVDTVYVMGVDDNGTPNDPTDDKMVPLDLNSSSYVLYSGVAGRSRTYDNSLVSQYDDCVAELKDGNKDYQGCILSGVDGNNTSVPAPVLDGIRGQYIGDDQCLVDTVHVTSNNVLNGLTVKDRWKKIYANTLTVSAIGARSIKGRVASLLGVSQNNVKVVMAMDGGEQPVEWQPKNTVDLSQVEQLSAGKYKAPDVEIPNFCVGGSWSLTKTAQEVTPTLTKLFGSQLTDRDWMNSNAYTPVTVPVDITQIKFNPDGSWIDLAKTQAVGATTATG